METLGVLHVDGLDVAVELLLGALLVVTLARDANAEAEGNTLNTTLPDLLVQLGVEADVASALDGGKNQSAPEIWKSVSRVSCAGALLPEFLWACAKHTSRQEKCSLTMAFSAKALISLMARGARFLKVTP